MPTPDIIDRWQVLLDLLRSQVLGGSDTNVVEQTRERVRRFAQDVDQKIVPLTCPTFDDPAFEGLRFGHPGNLDGDPLNDEGEQIRQQLPVTFDTVNIPVITDYAE